MNEPEAAGAGLWTPFTFRGVAAFAGASCSRVVTIQLLAALIIVGASIWFLGRAWLPVVDGAVTELPESGAIRGGRLEWTAKSPSVLSENSFLSLSVDAGDVGRVGPATDISVELGREAFSIRSLAWSFRIPYSRAYAVALNHPEVVPFWGAWRPFLLTAVAAGILVVLLAQWWLLAAVYALPLWFAGVVARREAGPSACWKLAAAALIPAGLLVGLALVLYGAAAVDLIRFLLLAACHVPLGWLYAGLAFRHLPVRVVPGPAVGANPFGNRGDAESGSSPGNPFAGSGAVRTSAEAGKAVDDQSR